MMVTLTEPPEFDDFDVVVLRMMRKDIGFVDDIAEALDMEPSKVASNLDDLEHLGILGKGRFYQVKKRAWYVCYFLTRYGRQQLDRWEQANATD